MYYCVLEHIETLSNKTCILCMHVCICICIYEKKKKRRNK